MQAAKVDWTKYNWIENHQCKTNLKGKSSLVLLALILYNDWLINCIVWFDWLTVFQSGNFVLKTELKKLATVKSKKADVFPSHLGNTSCAVKICIFVHFLFKLLVLIKVWPVEQKTTIEQQFPTTHNNNQMIENGCLKTKVIQIWCQKIVLISYKANRRSCDRKFKENYINWIG